MILNDSFRNQKFIGQNAKKDEEVLLFSFAKSLILTGS